MFFTGYDNYIEHAFPKVCSCCIGSHLLEYQLAEQVTGKTLIHVHGYRMSCDPSVALGITAREEWP